ncbi:hypothetical protein CA951_29840 [Rhodococcus sp. NCIMB 12038]|nr:hypothetical protein CA951_29840 [Rhodococcus sp. NCIMB 12038]
MLLAACGGTGGGSDDGDVIKLGVLVSQTGPFAAAGEAHLGSIKVGVDKVNRAGGVTVDGHHYTFEVVSQDAATDPAKASAGVQTLLRDEGAKFIVGTGETITIQAIEPLIRNKDVLWIGGSTYLSGKLEQVGAGDGYENVFATNPSAASSYPAYIEGLLRYMPETKTAAVLWPAGASYDGFADLIEKAFTDRGVEVVDVLRYDLGAQDFSTLLTRLKASSPDVLFTGTTTAGVSAIASQSVDLGSPFKAIVSHGTSSGIGMTANNGGPLPFAYIYSMNRGIDPNVGSPEVDAFFDDYERVNGRVAAPDAQQYASEFSSSIEILAAAMDKAGTVDDIDAISKAMTEVQVDAPTGKVGYGPKHVLEAPLAVCAIISGAGSCETVDTADAGSGE